MQSDPSAGPADARSSYEWMEAAQPPTRQGPHPRNEEMRKAVGRQVMSRVPAMARSDNRHEHESSSMESAIPHTQSSPHCSDHPHRCSAPPAGSQPRETSVFRTSIVGTLSFERLVRSPSQKPHSGRQENSSQSPNPRLLSSEVPTAQARQSRCEARSNPLENLARASIALRTVCPNMVHKLFEQPRIP